MQTIIVAGVVLVCLAAVLRGAWRQFSAKESAGCGGCSAAQGCSQGPRRSCASTPAKAKVASATLQWHPPSTRD